MENEENKMQENNIEQVDTATTETTEEKVEETPKMFSQEQINDIVRERLERDRKATYKKYGVETSEELDDLIGKAQAYDVVNQKFEELQEANKSLTQEYAFIKNNINPDRIDDIKIYFKGKELELNHENLFNEMQTHPEWLNVVKSDEKPKTTIEKISPDREAKHTETEREKAMKLFGF